MKNVAFLFLLSFLFFFLGQLVWSVGLTMEQPLFGSKFMEDWVINIIFTLCSIFGLIASVRWYNFKQ